jgi:hypothetical protein
MVGTFYAIPYWISPGHFVYNGMITSLYRNNMETVRADPGSEFYTFIGCTSEETVCDGTAFDYITWFYGGEYGQKMPKLDVCLLAAFLIASRVLTFVALKYIRHS